MIAAAAADTALPFLVYSSVGGVDRGSGVPHFESKHRIEEVLLRAVPMTFVRPTFFMETLRLMIRRDGARVTVAMPLAGDVAVQMISVRDIGRVAAALLLMADPAVAPVEIAGDELTGEQIAGRIAHRLGSPATYVELPLDVLGDDVDLKLMFGWLGRLPAYRADFARTYSLLRWVPLPVQMNSEPGQDARTIFRRGWASGYRKLAGPLPGLAPFLTWAAAVLERDLGRKIGLPGFWLNASDIQSMHEQQVRWGRRAGLEIAE